MKVWSTKYALSQGIMEFSVEDEDGSMVTCTSPTFLNKREYLHGEGKEWHRSLEAATRRFTELQILKTASLQRKLKQIADLHPKVKVIS